MAEATGGIIIGIGIVVALYCLLRTLITRTLEGYLQTRLVLSRFLALGLEFQLAADILGTAISPTWDQLGQLAAIAVIRTFLNFFLARERRRPRSARSKAAIGRPEVGSAMTVSGLLTPSCYSGDGGRSGWVLTWNGNSASICSRVWALGNSVKRWRR